MIRLFIMRRLSVPFYFPHAFSYPDNFSESTCRLLSVQKNRWRGWSAQGMLRPLAQCGKTATICCIWPVFLFDAQSHFRQGKPMFIRSLLLHHWITDHWPIANNNSSDTLLDTSVYQNHSSLLSPWFPPPRLHRFDCSRETRN